MRGEGALPRRVMLAALGGSTAGLASVTQAAETQDEDNEPPYTMRYEGVEVTMHDCARVTIDAETPNAEHVEIGVFYNNDGERATGTERFEFEPVNFPFEFVANCHLDELDVAYGSAIISEVDVINAADGTRGHFSERYHWPGQEWGCFEVMDEEVDPYVIENFCD